MAKRIEKPKIQPVMKGQTHIPEITSTRRPPTRRQQHPLRTARLAPQLRRHPSRTRSVLRVGLPLHLRRPRTARPMSDELAGKLTRRIFGKTCNPLTSRDTLGAVGESL